MTLECQVRLNNRLYKIQEILSFCPSSSPFCGCVHAMRHRKPVTQLQNSATGTGER